MTKRKTKKAAENRVWVVAVEYTVRGTVVVEAPTEEAAREAAHDEMTCPGTCTLSDWDVTSVREQAD